MAPMLILDASVMINLLGSGKEKEVLVALERKPLMIDVTSREIRRHPLRPKEVQDPLQLLVQQNLVQLMPLPTPAASRFVELTGAPDNDGLDDGEAAALAAGDCLNVPVAIDERKGRRIAAARLPHLRLLSSAELFLSPAVVDALAGDLADAVFSALLHARMRVLPEHVEQVVDLVGLGRVAQCPTLRRFGLLGTRQV